MKHVSEIKLIEYCADRLTSDEADAVRKHLADCDVCRRIYQQQAELHQQLGDVPMPELQVDMVERVQRAITESAMGTVRQVDRRWKLAGVLRIAAVLMLSAAVGHVAGLVITDKRQPTAANLYEAQMIDEQQVALALHLDKIGGGLTVGLLEALEGEQLNPEGETQ